MSRLRWSDEERERLRYTARHQDFTDQGSSSHLPGSGWRTLSNDTARYGVGRWERDRDRPRDVSPRQEYFSSSVRRDRITRYTQSHRELANDHQPPGYSRNFPDYNTSSTRNSLEFHSRNFPDLHSSGRYPVEFQSNSGRNSADQHSSVRNNSDLQSILVKPPAHHYPSYSSSSSNLNASSRSLSHTFLELQDETLPSESQLMERGRLRNQSLTYGVSEADLERAARTVAASDQLPFSLQIPNSLRRETRQSRTRHSLPDLFESLNYQPRPDIAPAQNTPGGSVTFQSPVVSSTPTTSILPPPPPAPSTSSPSASLTTKEDETLKMLQRHYLQAILTLAPAHKLSEASTTIKNQAQAQAQAEAEAQAEAAAKEENNLPSPPAKPQPQDEETSLNHPPPKMLDSILKLWEESQAENGKLRQDMTAMRMELEATKQQLENAFQANSSVSDAEKEERKAMEKKLEEMEEKLTSFTVNNVALAESEMTVSKLKEDNNRLREENAGLIKVMAKLSDCKK